MDLPEGNASLGSLEEFESAKKWKLTQWFRKMDEEDPSQQELQPEDFDHISAVEFDETGRFLATGDHSGNVVILENDGPGKNGVATHFTFFAEFQSHFHEFNFTRAEPVEPRINSIKFGPCTNDSVFLLVSSEKRVKYWSIRQHERYTLIDWNIDPEPTNHELHSPNHLMQNLSSSLQTQRANPIIKRLKVPKKQIVEAPSNVEFLRRMYAPLHEYDIMGVAMSADKEHFLSADNFRVNVWDLYHSDECFTVHDIAPDDVADLREIITCLDCHPTSSNLFINGTSRGVIKLCDLRERALISQPSMSFTERMHANTLFDDEQNDEDWDPFGSLDSISEARFSKGGRFIISRDYMSVKIWDVTMDKQPVQTFYVHEYLRPNLHELLAAQSTADQFKIGLSPRGDVVTGTYSNYFHVLNLGENRDTFIQTGNINVKTVPLDGLKNQKMDHLDEEDQLEEESEDEERLPVDDYPHNIPVQRIEFGNKILNCAWHPGTDTIAVSGQNNVFVYSKV